MQSFWERESFTQYDYIVVGAGIVGCSTAYHLKKRFPDANIAILERGVFPSGASTKNAGFACFGSLTELADDLPTMGENELVKLVQKRWDGLMLLKSILGEDIIDYQHNRGYELIREKELPVLSQISYFNEILKDVFKADVFKNEPKLVRQFSFDQKSVHTIVSNQFEGQVDTGKMMNAWWALCGKLGIRLFTGVAVEKISDSGEITASGPLSKPIRFNADRVAICTNAFTARFLPEVDIKPGRGMCMVTKPITGLPFKGVFHYDEGYFYFRNIGNRVLIGGGRNLDRVAEETTEFGINPIIRTQILKDLKEIIIPNLPFEIEMEWSGIMAFGKVKAPIIKRINADLIVGARLGGMGVAVGTKVGKEISELLSQQY